MLKNRILASWVVAFTIGIGIGLYFDGKIRLTVFACFGVLCGLLLAAHLFCKFDIKKILTVSVIIFIGIGYSAVYSVFVLSQAEDYNRKKDIVMAEIVDIGNYVDSGYFDISILESRIGIEKGIRVRLYYSDDKDNNFSVLRRGDIIKSSLTYKTHKNNSLFSKNITLISQGYITESELGQGFFYEIRKDTEKITSRLFRNYSKDVSGIAKTLAVGETSDMDPYTYELFRNAGLSHLLVISGLHISIIVMSLYGFLEFFTVSKRIRSIVCLFVLLTYAVFVGFSPSVSRAAIMTGIMLTCTLVTRRADSLTSLFLALFVLLLYNPYNLFSISLELSFLSCLGILILSPYLMRPFKVKGNILRKILRVAFSPMLFTMAATVFTFPVLFSFDTVSYISPLTNLLITPIFTYLLIILVPCVLLFSMIGVGAEVISFIPGNIINFTLNILNIIYESGIGRFSTYIPYMIIPLLFSISVILALCFFRRKKMYIIAGILLLCFITSVVFCNINFNIKCKNSSVAVYNDGYLYNSLFVADGKKSIYVDLGGKKSGVSTVYKHGYCSLDYYVLTSITEQDENRLESALSSINISVLYVPKENSDLRISDRIKKLAKMRNCDIIEYNKLLYKNIGRSAVEIKVSTEGFTAEVNRNGKSVKVYSGKRSEDKKDFGFNDVVIIKEDFTDPYTDIFCTYRCLKFDDKNAPPEFLAGAEKLYNLSESEYIKIEIIGSRVEVNTNEP